MLELTVGRRMLLAAAIAAGVIALALSSPSGLTAPQSASAAPHSGKRAQTPLGARLADQVLNGKNLRGAVKATQRVLALSGVATVRDGKVLVAPVAPVSRWRMTARETVLLAQGAGSNSVKLGTIASQLSAAGLQMGNQPARSELPKMVKRWLGFAGKHKAQALSAPALFIRQMQMREVTRVPARVRLFYPARMWLSPLEALVVIANLERVLEPVTGRSAKRRPTANASAGGPCAAVKEKLEGLGPVGSGIAEVVIGEGTSTAVEAYADTLKDGAGDKVGKVMTGLDLADRLLRTIAFAQHVEVRVFPVLGKQVVDEVHKPFNGSPLVMHFAAIVGLSDEARKDLAEQLKFAEDHPFQEAMRNCAKLHGVSIPRPYGDLAEEMTEWSAYWTLHSSPSDVRWGHPRRTDLKRVNVAETATEFKIFVQDESKARHFAELSSVAVRQAVGELEIHAQKPPSPVAIAKLVTAIVTMGEKGDFVGPIAEMAEGMFRTAFKPTGAAGLDVERHTEYNPCPFRSAAARC